MPGWDGAEMTPSDKTRSAAIAATSDQRFADVLVKKIVFLILR